VKILDRYILWSYLRNYLLSLMVLIGLYIVLDMVFNFDEFAVSREGAGAGAMIANIAEYYFFQSFRIFAQLSGVIPVVAAAFTFLRLSRFNELTAMMAAGINLVRVATPAIIAAVAVSILVPLINQEIIIPSIIPQLTRGRTDQVDQQKRNNAIQNMRDVMADQPDHFGLLFAASYTPPVGDSPAVMEKVDRLEIDEDFNLVGHLSADKATFDAANSDWKLENGQLTTEVSTRNRHSQAIPVYKSNVTPEEIALYRSGDYVELLGTSRINELLQRTQVYGANDLLRVKHARLAQLLLNIIMVLLAISCVLIREQGQLRTAVMKCLILVGLCMVTVFICQNLAATPPNDPRWTAQWPALMAWMPIFIFGPLSVFLLDRVKT